ncbi:unnamed protein product [Xylocopa violacea]|uniref:MD-2-related lipid-recognition domain-containing protein n=1 Tax=Xylocopa violacea TaxID=135666 RepID=A0ABP1P8P1_XYLVO
MLFWLFTVFALRCCVVQADYDIIIEDVVCSDINEEYIKSCDFEVEYDSEYGNSLNSYVEIIKTIPKNAKIIGDIFSARMGEYTVPVGLHVNGYFCEVLGDSDSIIIPIARSVNIDHAECPLEPRIYQRENFVLDSKEGLPTAFPSGHYLLSVTFECDNVTIMHFDVYLRVY